MEQQRQYVGIDLHGRRSVIVRRSAEGETLSTVRIDNDAIALAAEVAKAGDAPEVVLEATLRWYWAADVVAELGASVHLAHPLGNNWGHRRVKNGEHDATDLVDLLRMGRLAEAWVAPPALRSCGSWCATGRYAEIGITPGRPRTGLFRASCAGRRGTGGSGRRCRHNQRPSRKTSSASGGR